MRPSKSTPVFPDKTAAARSVPTGFAMAGILLAGVWLAHLPQATAAPVSAADPAGVTFDGKTYTNRLIHSRDREERPDIDRIYMLITQTLTGREVCPNNVFLTPDLRRQLFPAAGSRRMTRIQAHPRDHT